MVFDSSAFLRIIQSYCILYNSSYASSLLASSKSFSSFGKWILYRFSVFEWNFFFLIISIGRILGKSMKLSLNSGIFFSNQSDEI